MRWRSPRRARPSLSSGPPLLQLRRGHRELVALVALAILALETGDLTVLLLRGRAGVAAGAGGGVRRAGAGRKGAGQRRVAVQAGDPGMRSGRELEAAIVGGKARGAEAPWVVAVAAVGAEARGNVIDGDRLRSQVIGLVTGPAIHGRAREPAVALVLVALFAGDERVPAGEREVRAPVRIGVEAAAPALRVVARSAAGAEFAGMSVAVAGRAASRDGGAEVDGSVTSRAAGCRVAAEEREPGTVVIERHLAPAFGRMAGATAGVHRRVRGDRHGRLRAARRSRNHRARRESRHRPMERPHGVNPWKVPRCTSTWHPSHATGSPR